MEERFITEPDMEFTAATSILTSMHQYAALGAAALFLAESALLGLVLSGRSKSPASRS